MKPEIHPKYDAMKATCSCGNVIETRSTMAQKILDTGGRVERFKNRFGSRRV